jgi:hypothetical protein
MGAGTDIFEQRIERSGHTEIMARVLKWQVKKTGGFRNHHVVPNRSLQIKWRR